MYTKVAENWLEDRLDPLQQQFLQKTLDYYETFTSRWASTPAVVLEHGMAYQRMGEIQRKLGRYDEAQRLFSRALFLLRPLAAQSNVDSRPRRALGVTLARQGDLLFRLNLIDEAENFLGEAETQQEALLASPAATSADRWLLARTVRGQAELRRRKGDLLAARPLALRACDLLEHVQTADPEAPEARNDLAQANDILGRIARDLGDSELNERAHRRSYGLLDRLVTEYPTVPRYREALVHACNGLGNLEYETGRLGDCESRWRRMLGEAERMTQDFPGRPEFQRLLAGACSNLGGVLAEQDRFAEAEPILRRSITLDSGLAKQMPEDREIDFDLGNCYHNLGYLLLKRGRAEEALESLAKGETIERSLVQKLPRTPRCRRSLALILRWRGDALEQLGHPGADAAYGEGVSILEKLTAEFPANVLYQLDLARCLNKHGEQMAKAGHNDQAERDYQQALAALSVQKIKEWPLECRREKAMTLSNQGVFRHEAHRLDAEGPLRSSVHLARELASGKNPAHKDRQYLAIAHNNLGEALRDRGRNDEAWSEFQQAVEGLDHLVAERPGVVEDRFYLGYINEQMSKLLVQMNQPAEARTALAKAVASQKEAVKLTDGRSPLHRATLASHLKALAEVCLPLRDYDAVHQAAVDLARTTPDPSEGCLSAARLLARCASQLQADLKLTTAQGRAGQKVAGAHRRAAARGRRRQFRAGQRDRRRPRIQGTPRSPRVPDDAGQLG